VSQYDPVKTLSSANKARESVGMSKVKIKLRHCLSCGKEFKAQGNNNHRCEYCRRESKDYGFNL